jgi:outer membrane protein OmpA-like peptidoglycan-associated protein
MSKSTDKRFEHVNKLFDELLGRVEDWPGGEVDQFLADAGVDIEVASRSLYERISDLAGTYRGRNQNIPDPIAEFLQQTRPVDLPTQDQEVARTAARKWIARLRRPKPQFADLQVAYAFRNKKDQLSSKDRAILEDLEAKLKNRNRGNR